MGISQSKALDSPVPKGPIMAHEQGLSPGACGLYDFSNLLVKTERKKRKFSNSTVTFQNDDPNEKTIQAIQHFLIAVREVSLSSEILEKLIKNSEV